MVLAESQKVYTPHLVYRKDRLCGIGIGVRWYRIGIGNAEKKKKNHGIGVRDYDVRWYRYADKWDGIDVGCMVWDGSGHERKSFAASNIKHQ